MTERIETDAGLALRTESLLPHLALAFKRTVKVVESESGMAGMRWFLLKATSWQEGLSQAEFCQRYEMLDASRVTRTAQSLQAEGYLRRERDPGDNRVVRMYLTEAGREFLDGVPDINERVMGRVRSVLDEAEVSELRRMLDLVSEAMKHGDTKAGGGA